MTLAEATGGVLSPGEVFSLLPALAVLLPVLGALAVRFMGDRNEGLRDLAAVVFAGATFLTVLSMLPRVLLSGHTLVVGPPVFIGGFRLIADAQGLLFALVASLLWFVSTVYALSYVRHEQRRTRYHTFTLLTEAAALGVFLAGDFFVLFVFFELMGMLAYVLVIHNQSEESLRAGVKYIFMTVYGGLSLLMGVFLFLAHTGGVGFAVPADSSYLSTSAGFVAAGFMMGGFGVKAGMVPLHVWLPKAHPAAPTPASALLSGVMIKAGAFGLLRLVGTFHIQSLPESTAGLLAAEGGTAAPAVLATAPPALLNLHTIGLVLMLLAVVTMVVGAALAFVQTNAKRLLAYSSISQMGFVLLGIGIGAYMGPLGSMGIAGSLYHILNHALFKSLLFLGIGAVYYRTHEIDMTKLGGLWRRMPFTALFTFVAGLGIMGITVTNGYISKTLLHHAVVKTSYLAGPWATVLDVFFIATAGGTVCYISKLLYFVFLGENRGDRAAYDKLQDPPRPMLFAMGFLALLILGLGLFPIPVIRVLLLPVLHGFAYLDPHAVAHLLDEQFFAFHEVKGILPPLAIGLPAFLIAKRFDLFRARLPRWCGIDYYYTRVEETFLALLLGCPGGYGRLRGRCNPALRKAKKRFTRALHVGFGSETYARLATAFTAALRRAVHRLLTALPEGMRREVRAFVGDIAFGVVAIAVILGLLAWTLV